MFESIYFSSLKRSSDIQVVIAAHKVQDHIWCVWHDWKNLLNEACLIYHLLAKTFKGQTQTAVSMVITAV